MLARWRLFVRGRGRPKPYMDKGDDERSAMSEEQNPVPIEEVDPQAGEAGGENAPDTTQQNEDGSVVLPDPLGESASEATEEADDRPRNEDGSVIYPDPLASEEE